MLQPVFIIECRDRRNEFPWREFDGIDYTDDAANKQIKQYRKDYSGLRFRKTFVRNENLIVATANTFVCNHTN